MKTFNALSLSLFLFAVAFAQVPEAPANLVVNRDGAPAGYVAGAADLDDTEYMSLISSGPTGLADGKAFTFSFWYNPDSDNNFDGLVTIYNGINTNRLQYRVSDGNQLIVVGRNSSSTVILDLTSSVTFASGGGWYHIHAFFDLTNASNRGLVINGTADSSATWGTYTNDTIDVVGTSYRYFVGARAVGTPDQFINGQIAEVFFDDSYISDTTIFRNATTGKPEDLGSVGTSAVFHFGALGGGNDIRLNNGTADDMTVSGSFDAATPP